MMRNRTLFLGSAFLLLALPAAAQNWTLAWSDEFNGPAGSLPDSTKWTYDVGGNGWGNSELETYCAPQSDGAPCDPAQPNAYLDGQGNLVIKSVNKNGKWTSARLKTAGLFSFTYGRAEARMKLPAANGFWPAFWMLGSDIGEVGWPKSGEQDIIEWVDKYGADTTSSTTHGPGYSGCCGIGTQYTFPNGGRIDDGYHIYGVVWSKDSIKYYRETPDNVILSMSPASIPQGTEWVYNHPFFLLLNFAVGGAWFPGPDASTPDTGEMLIDYVRVYQESSGS